MVKKRGPVWDHWTERSIRQSTHPAVRCNYCSKIFDRAVPKRMQAHLNNCTKAPNNAKSTSEESFQARNNRESSTNSEPDRNHSCQEFDKYDYICFHCQQRVREKRYPCQSCISNLFQKDDGPVDDLVKKIQEDGWLFEKIPYDRLSDVGHGCDSESSLYSAIWVDGVIQNWNQKSNKWKRSGPQDVYLFHIVLSKA